jgi:hypothetical protein
MSKNLPYGGAWAINDPQMEEFVKSSSLIALENMRDDSVTKVFLDSYVQWIKSTKFNKIQGLDNFPITAYSNGTTEAFDKFYLKNNTRRFRCFPGEYLYHQLAWRNYFPNWKFIENLDIEENDAVVISLPFSDTGNKHDSTEALLALCSKLSVPVLVDCAFFGICANIDFNFNHSCITDITFSLSKSFPVAHYRIGMRCSRVDDDDSLFVSNKANYTNKFGALLGIELMKFSPDHNWATWSIQQKKFCHELGIEPSNSVIFGIDLFRYPMYNRGNNTNRLCFAKYLKSGTLP